MNWSQTLREGFVLPMIDPETPLPDAVNTALGAVEQHLLNSKEIAAFIDALPKGPGTNCPESPIKELIRYVANQKGEVDKSDPALTLRFLQDHIMPVFEFERAVLFAVIGLIEDISEDEINLFDDCDGFGRAIYHLWSRWFEGVTVPYQSLNKACQASYEHLAKDTLAQWDYTAFCYNPHSGITDRQTWGQAFAGEIAAILGKLRTLKATKLPGLGEYFTALYNAYACTEIDRLEDLWTKVDEAWIRIPRTARLVPVHGMESGYEHPFGVSPEFRLEVRTSESVDLIRERREATLAHAAAFGLSNETVSMAVQKLDRIDISVFITAIREGVCLNFRYAGQAVPNRQQVLAEGGRIFVDKSASLRAAKMYAEKVREHCDSSTSDLLVPLVTEVSQLSATATHEYAHPIGRTLETDTGLGSGGMKLCEEAKATLLGILADEYRDPSPMHRLTLAANTVARVLRFMSVTLLESATFAPYARENLAAATTLFESGVMTLGPEGVAVNREVAESPAWFDALRTFNHGVLDAYRAIDQRALDALAARYCNREHPQVAELIAWVNRK